MIFQIMDQTGHTSRTFTPAQKAEADAKFRELIGQGQMLAYKTEAGVPTQVKSLDGLKDETEVVFTPQLVGG